MGEVGGEIETVAWEMKEGVEGGVELNFEKRRTDLS